MATNSEIKKRYVLAPTTYPWAEFDSPEEAIAVAEERIAKNQRCYGGSRVNMVYAICRVEAYVRPVSPRVHIEVVSADEQPHVLASIRKELRAIDLDREN